MLSLSQIYKSYELSHGRSSTILKGISFTVEQGEKVGILGRNGAGKSTLIRIISGAEAYDSGTISRKMTISWPLAFGGAFQGSLTGKDNLRLISRVYNRNFDQMLEFVEDFAELGNYLSEPVKTYSMGMNARLAFAISMAIEFDCYLIDEVLSVGDHRFTEKCNLELFEKRKDRSMIIVSHSTDLIRERCNRALVLEKGSMQDFPNIEDAINEYQSL